MSNTISGRPIEILLIEDNPGDVRLTFEAFKEAKLRNHLHVAQDGQDALDFLRRRGKYADAPRPDLILLDLNLPRKDGREVLGEIKADPELRRIPVIVSMFELTIGIGNGRVPRRDAVVTSWRDRMPL